MKKLTFILVTLFGIYSASANNIQVTNVSVVPATNTIQFTVTWDNGWRSNILNNWDAAWVFIKYYNPLAPGWVHLNLSSSGNTIPTGFTGTVTADGIGLFLYRSAVGSGTTTISNIQLAIPAQQASGIFDIKIFAIEMVYVPQGPFYVGDAISGSARYGGSSVQNTPGYISSASGLSGVYDPLCTGCSGGILNIPATFGNGFNAFYCMKYELTQGAYRDFINSLNYSQQVNHAGSTLSGSGFWVFGGGNRNWLVVKSPGSGITPAVIACNATSGGTMDDSNDGEWVPCNFLNWVDQAAYLDWAGLRPITELEYEKGSRGFLLPVAGEFAWGNANISTVSYTMANPFQASETIINASASPTGNATYVATADQSITGGPFRNGIFATATSNRITSGGSFYGIMDMSGNLVERVISTAGNEVNVFASVIHGDGMLSTDGYANVAGAQWPGAHINLHIIDGNTAATGLIQRGGNLTSPAIDLRISNRSSVNLITTNDVMRNTYSGIRGGRTAP